MSVNIEKLKQIPQRKKDIVFGYLKQSHIVLESSNDQSLRIIPSIVMYICLAFYTVTEYFNKCGNNFVITGEDNEIATYTKKGQIDETVYGHLWIDSMNKSITKWQITIKKCMHYGNGWICIGITSNDNCMDAAFYQNKNNINYPFINSKTPEAIDVSLKYGDEYGAGDMITMELDLFEGHVSFLRNNTIYDKPIKIQQKQDVKYKLAITMGLKDDCVILNSFEQQYTQ